MYWSYTKIKGASSNKPKNLADLKKSYFDKKIREN